MRKKRLLCCSLSVICQWIVCQSFSWKQSPRPTSNLQNGNGLSHATSGVKAEKEESTNAYPNDRTSIDAPTAKVLTNAVLKISFDGSHFTGWSAANGQLVNSQPTTRRKRQGRRRRGNIDLFTTPPEGTGFVRSVEGVLRENLAKLWGNVDTARVVVEGCSRTDRGVHATGMMAQIYCLNPDYTTATMPSGDVKTSWDGDQVKGTSLEGGETITPALIPGKQTPHPRSSTDSSSFLPLPMNGNLSRIAFSLNRMRPSDIQITGIAPTPKMLLTSRKSSSYRPDVFHASSSSISKTYRYRISTGYVLDPLLQRTVWHVTGRSSQSFLNLEKMEQACKLLQGSHDFVAFRGAPRGDHDKRRYAKQATTCTLLSITVRKEDAPIPLSVGCYFIGADPPLQHFSFEVTGDRFLYRMVRLLVGAIVAVGLDKLELQDISHALETGSWDVPSDPGGRRKQFTCAPARGLVLQHVDYGDSVEFDWQPLAQYPPMVTE
jgi:tRNA pseudouridine(38-40) synthase